MKYLPLLALILAPCLSLAYTVSVVGSSISYSGGTWPSHTGSPVSPNTFVSTNSEGWVNPVDNTDILYQAEIDTVMAFPDEFLSSSPLTIYLDRDLITIAYTIEWIPGESDGSKAPGLLSLTGTVQTGYRGSVRGTVVGTQDVSGEVDFGKRTNPSTSGSYAFDQFFTQIFPMTSDYYPATQGTYQSYRDVDVNFPTFSYIGGHWLSTGTVTYDPSTVEFDLGLVHIADCLNGDKTYGSIELSGEWRHRLYQIGSVWSQSQW